MSQRNSGFPHNARDFHETPAWMTETLVSVIDVAGPVSGSTTTEQRRSAISAPPDPALADGPGVAQSKSSANSSNQPTVQVNMIATAAEQVRP